MSKQLTLRDDEMKLVRKLVRENFGLVEVEELDIMRRLDQKMKKGLDRPSRRKP